MQVLNQNAQAIGTAAEKGQTAIHRATEVIQGIADTTQANASQAGNLSTKSQQVTSFSDINEHTSATINKVTAVTQLAGQQAQAANALKEVVQNVAAVTEQSAAATETTAASAEEVNASVEENTANATSLNQVAGELQDAVAKFKLN
jgi:methyl-accepting chemotaxis protein